jgi:hypothetical protein
VCGERWASLSKSYMVLLVDLADVRRLVIIAMFSDDVLFGKLVLKGGNAISLVYTYGARGSLDVDFSIEGEFEDTADAARRITRALTDRFDAAGFIVFDCIFGPRRLTPSADNARWVATEIQYKIIERDKHRRFNGELDAIRCNATMIGPLQQRVFTIDISKWEFCEGKTETKLEKFTIYVYTPSKVAGNLFGINEPWQGTFIPMGRSQPPVNSKPRFLHLLQPRLYDFFINFRVSFST